MIDHQAKELKTFFYSQAFADGVRITFAIILPALVLSYTNHFDIGLTISLGAACISLADAPGPIVHKKNGILFSIFFCAIVALLTPVARLHTFTMGIEIVGVCFFFTLLNVYGPRAVAVGNGSILLMILMMDKPIPLNGVILNAVFIIAGGFWYLAISMLVYVIRPYRIAQRALGSSIREIATYLSIKADFYNPSTSLEEGYKKMVRQQIVVHETQDELRQILFKTRQIVREATAEGRNLVFTFVETVDLFEDITATYYDYEVIRRSFSFEGILTNISSLLKTMAEDLSAIGMAIQTNENYRIKNNYDAALKDLKSQIDEIEKEQKVSVFILKKILVNIRRLGNRTSELNEYFNRRKTLLPGGGADHSRFVTHQPLDPKILWSNLTFSSAAFQHALRVSIACISGYIIAKSISYGHHSYWILMTIAFMLKPAFSLTKQRNIQRITGTVAGGVIGVALLLLINNKHVLFSIMVVFMIGTYSFQRIRYQLMVICTTPYIMILFSFLGVAFISLIKERLFDTILGCCIAFISSYVIFPNWESGKIKQYIIQMLEANRGYLLKVKEALCGKNITTIEYKLARKEVYVQSANLSSAFQRMLSEPKSKQTNDQLIHQFVVLNHILFSNTASIAKSVFLNERHLQNKQLIALASQSERMLLETIQLLDAAVEIKEREVPVPVEMNALPAANREDQLLHEQLSFIVKLCTDIKKTAQAIMAA